MAHLNTHNPDFCMYTRHGDRAVLTIVQRALKCQWTWRRTYQALAALETLPGYEEATDTAVREAVYETLCNHQPGWGDLNPFRF